MVGLVVAAFDAAAVVGVLARLCLLATIARDVGFARSIAPDESSSWRLCCALLVGFVPRCLLILFHRCCLFLRRHCCSCCLLGCLGSDSIAGSSQIDFFFNCNIVKLYSFYDR